MANSSTIAFALISIIAIQFQYGHTFKVLGIFHKTSKSHFIAGSALMKGLAYAGHNVTVISNYPQNKPIENYRDIDISNPDDDNNVSSKLKNVQISISKFN